MTTTKPIDAILFDLDGTLLDSAPDFYRIISLLMQEEGLSPPSFQQLRQVVSEGAKAMLSNALQLPREHDKILELQQRMLNLYADNPCIDSQLFPGTHALLTQLETLSIPWGVVTNKSEKFAAPILESLNLTSRCGILVCPEQVKNVKPDPEALYYACDALRVAPTRCIYVGDHKRDIEAGQNAHMTTVSALYGYISQSDDPSCWQSDHYINHITDISQIIESNLSLATHA